MLTGKSVMLQVLSLHVALEMAVWSSKCQTAICMSWIQEAALLCLRLAFVNSVATYLSLG